MLLLYNIKLHDSLSFKEGERELTKHTLLVLLKPPVIKVLIIETKSPFFDKVSCYH